AAFARHGFPEGQVRVAAHRVETPELAKLPPLGVFWLDAANDTDEAEALAAGVATLLARPADTPVEGRERGGTRALRPGDVAILTAFNAEAGRIAAALARRGVAASLPRQGLLDQPEGTLLLAALRFLVDPDDALAIAELEALTGFGGLDPDRWLEE